MKNYDETVRGQSENCTTVSTTRCSLQNRLRKEPYVEARSSPEQQQRCITINTISSARNRHTYFVPGILISVHSAPTHGFMVSWSHGLTARFPPCYYYYYCYRYCYCYYSYCYCSGYIFMYKMRCFCIFGPLFALTAGLLSRSRLRGMQGVPPALMA